MKFEMHLYTGGHGAAQAPIAVGTLAQLINAQRRFEFFDRRVGRGFEQARSRHRYWIRRASCSAAAK